MNGSFREFRFQTFDGSINYAVDGVRLDTKLSQTPDAWIAAKGFVPAAAFKPADAAEVAAVRADEHVPGTPGEQLDVAITSSALSLGIVEGLTPQVTKVSGTLQADVRVTGSPRDPHLNGSIDIRNGAFTVAELTKSGYTGLDTRITLAPDRVRLEEFSLVDEHKHTLSVSGELADAPAPDRRRPDRDQIGSVRGRRQPACRRQAEHRLADHGRAACASRGGDARRAHGHHRHRPGARR